MNYVHIPVLLDEVLDGLNIRKDGVYVDCTFGCGGHSRSILHRLGPDGKLLALDKDPVAMQSIDKQLLDDKRFSFVQRSFTEIDDVINSMDLAGKVDGILLDLGVSSPQLDDPARGFSFYHDGELDMRMDKSTGLSASKWLNSVKEKELRNVIKEYGEERYAGRIARKIIAVRKSNPIKTTLQLADLIASVVPGKEQGKHPATRTFQAIRIYINNELEALETVLEKSIELLAKGGRILVISFHSLEDRIVKRFMKRMSRGDHYPVEIPISNNNLNPVLSLIAGPISPTSQEILNNQRARSAKLRIAEKVD